ncbi:tail fiber protein [Enterobacter asburiae]|uniref:tail fiber protein n=1 Tax=Enterobacter asburiae TaxID=61645 RepID=UPI002B25142B|nr:tail fiber protein [Enterobacter asburiae]MEB2411169.1 tail fiber protein [Enterobacter asburiae]
MANLPETPQWEDGIYQIEVSDPVLGGPDGISNRQAKQLASRTSYLKQKVEKGGTDLAAHIVAADPHTQYAMKASPTFTGTPTAPTPSNSDNSKKLATTEFVANALAALVGSSPEALDTLNELAAALGNDANFAATMTNALAGKQPLNSTLTNLSGKDVAGILQYLGLGEGSALPVGVPIPWPSATPPIGWLKCNGAAFTASQYPKLAQAYPALRLPDLRGEFIRGWDDGRGVDTGRELLSSQEHSVISHNHAIPTTVNTQTAIPPGVEQAIANETIFSSAAQYGCDYWANGGRTFTYMSGGKNGAENINDTSSMKAETRPRNVVFNYIVRAA